MWTSHTSDVCDETGIRIRSDLEVELMPNQRLPLKVAVSVAFGVDDSKRSTQTLRAIGDLREQRSGGAEVAHLAKHSQSLYFIVKCIDVLAGPSVGESLKRSLTLRQRGFLRCPRCSRSNDARAGRAVHERCPGR